MVNKYALKIQGKLIEPGDTVEIQTTNADGSLTDHREDWKVKSLNFDKKTVTVRIPLAGIPGTITIPINFFDDKAEIILKDSAGDPNAAFKHRKD